MTREKVKQIFLDSVMSTICPIELIAKLADELKKFNCLSIDTKEAIDELMNFIYSDSEQDMLLDFLYVVYTQVVINGIADDINILRETTKSFLLSPVLDNEYREYINGNLIANLKGEDKIITTIKLLRFYLPQLELCLIKKINLT